MRRMLLGALKWALRAFRRELETVVLHFILKAVGETMEVMVGVECNEILKPRAANVAASDASPLWD